MFGLLTKRVCCFYKCNHSINSFDANLLKAMSATLSTKDGVTRNKSRISKYKDKLADEAVSPTFDVSVVNSGCHGYSKSLVISTYMDIYLFNCGEDTQRQLPDVCREKGRLYNVFFTYNSWSNVGGLIGLMLTVHQNNLDRGKPIKIHGPENVSEVLSMIKHFSEFDVGSQNRIETVGVPEGKFEDSQMTIEYVVLEPQISPDLHGNSEGGATVGGQGSPAGSEGHEDEQQTDETADTPGVKKSVAYIVTPKSRPRKIDKQKLIALGQKSGPWIGQLVKGNTVTLDDGRVIHPEDMLQDVEIHRPIVILECPTVDYLDSLLASEQLAGLCRESDRVPELIVHMSPLDVINNDKYNTFMDRYSTDSTRHLMLNEDTAEPFRKKSSEFVSVLNQLHPGVFPLLQAHTHNSTPHTPGQGHMTPARFGLTYSSRPHRNYLWSDVPYLRHKEAIDEVLLAGIEVEKQLELLQERLQEESENISDVAEYPEIVFLGTGASQPCGRRNVSGILVQTREDDYILLDCGEGTLSQLYQLYGSHVSHILQNLRAIFISHLHYDHHGGLFGILEARTRALQDQAEMEKLLVLAPRNYLRWIRLYSKKIEDAHARIQFIPHQFMDDRREANMTDESEKMLNTLKTSLNLKDYMSVPLIHTVLNYGVVLTHNDGWKLVYSGDTRPSPKLVTHGRDCDYLIHEATFSIDDNERALLVKHSTSEQAIDVGRQMKARYTLLTHFSQKFPKIPAFTEHFKENVGFAFDFMKVRPRDIPLIHLFRPVLEAMFWNEKASRDKPEKEERPDPMDSLIESLSENKTDSTPVVKAGKKRKADESVS